MALNKSNNGVVKVAPMAVGLNRLPVCEYQEYYDIIITDNEEQLKTFLKTQKDTQALLKYEFDFQHDKKIKSKNIKRVLHPFHLAVSMGSRRVAAWMIQEGVDGEQLDYAGRNVLHNLVTMAAYNIDLEDGACAIIPWLGKNLGYDAMMRLAGQENEDGLRPVEYAAQQNTLKLLKLMLEMKGFHTISEVTKGDTSYRQLDVTEYETGGRFSKSPLTMLAFLDKKKLEDPNTVKLFHSSVLQSWMSAKLKTNAIPLVLWTLFRCIMLTIYFVADANVSFIKDQYGENASDVLCEDLAHVTISNTGIIAISVTFLIAISIFVSFAVIFFIRRRKYGLYKLQYSLYGKKNLLSNAFFFEITDWTFISLIFALIVAVLLSVSGVNGVTLLIDVIRLIMPLICIWNIIFSAQLLPFLGPFLISIQGMIAVLVQFLLLFILFMIPFAHGFQTFIMGNSKQGCIEEFSSFLYTCYSLFKMMLNMIDLTQYDITNIGALYAMHIAFVFVVAVLLLNFLVAVMAESAAKVADNEKVIIMVNQLNVMASIEESYFWSRSWMYKMFNRIGYSVVGEKVLLRYETCRASELVERMLANQ